MEPILYWYPVYYLNGEEPYGSAVVRKSGRIIPFQLKKEPYEVDVEAGGKTDCSCVFRIGISAVNCQSF